MQTLSNRRDFLRPRNWTWSPPTNEPVSDPISSMLAAIWRFSLSNCKPIVILNLYFWFYLSMIQPPYWQKTQRLVFEGLPESPMTLCSNCQPRNMKCWWSLNTRSEKYHPSISYDPHFEPGKNLVLLLAAISHAVPGRLRHDRQWSLGWENKVSTASGWNLVGFESICKPQG